MSKNYQQRLLNRPTKQIPDPYRRSKRSRPRWRRSLHYFYLRFIRLRGTPESIARGLAAGVFAGLFPLIATQMAVAILIAALIRGNKMAAATATWISNPLTGVPIYAFNFQVGQWLLGSEAQSFSAESFNSWQDIMQLGTVFVTDLLVGCLVVASVSAVCSYFLALWVVRQVRDRRSQHLD